MILSILTTLRSVRFSFLEYQGSASPLTHAILLRTVHSAVSPFTFLFFLHTILIRFF